MMINPNNNNIDKKNNKMNRRSIKSFSRKKTSSNIVTNLQTIPSCSSNQNNFRNNTPITFGNKFNNTKNSNINNNERLPSICSLLLSSFLQKPTNTTLPANNVFDIKPVINNDSNENEVSVVNNTEENTKPLVTDLKITKSKYTTSLDARGYIPVFEYTINSQPIIWDRENHNVYWTGIWKALGRDKSELLKLIENDIRFTTNNNMKRIRGGYLKIQGTWLSYKLARTLAIRTCYRIRIELCILFGSEFKNEAIPLDHPQFMHAPLNAKSIKLFQQDLINYDNIDNIKNKTGIDTQNNKFVSAKAELNEDSLSKQKCPINHSYSRKRDYNGLLLTNNNEDYYSNNNDESIQNINSSGEYTALLSEDYYNSLYGLNIPNNNTPLTSSNINFSNKNIFVMSDVNDNHNQIENKTLSTVSAVLTSSTETEDFDYEKEIIKDNKIIDNNLDMLPNSNNIGLIKKPRLSQNIDSTLNNSTERLTSNKHQINCSLDFVQDKNKLDDAIYASLCLQKLKSSILTSDQNNKNNETIPGTLKSSSYSLQNIIHPPYEFKIGQIEFEYDNKANTYRQKYNKNKNDV